MIEDSGLFDETYPNIILVPLAEDSHLAISDLAVKILHTPENGCTKACFAIMSRPRGSTGLPRRPPASLTRN